MSFGKRSRGLGAVILNNVKSPGKINMEKDVQAVVKRFVAGDMDMNLGVCADKKDTRTCQIASMSGKLQLMGPNSQDTVAVRMGPSTFRVAPGEFGASKLHRAAANAVLTALSAGMQVQDKVLFKDIVNRKISGNAAIRATGKMAADVSIDQYGLIVVRTPKAVAKAKSEVAQRREYEKDFAREDVGASDFTPGTFDASQISDPAIRKLYQSQVRAAKGSPEHLAQILDKLERKLGGKGYKKARKGKKAARKTKAGKSSRKTRKAPRKAAKKSKGRKHAKR